MAMTKKDYELVAQAIKVTRYNSLRAGERDYQLALDNLAGRISNLLSLNNDRFDQARFLQACEYGKLPRQSEVA